VIIHKVKHANTINRQLRVSSVVCTQP